MFWAWRRRREQARQAALRTAAAPPAAPDSGFDTAGFVVGLTTGVPISPSRGISPESLLGASLHTTEDVKAAPASDPQPSHHTTPPAVDITPSDAPSYDSGGSSSYDSGGSSSYDAGSSSSTSSC